jgi:hypothetical protein
MDEPEPMRDAKPDSIRDRPGIRWLLSLSLTPR